MKSLYQDILEISEQVERLLCSGDLGNLPSLLTERQQVFSKLNGVPQDEEGVLIKQILDCEERCKSLAMEKKKKLKKDIVTTQNRKKLHQAYGRA